MAAPALQLKDLSYRYRPGKYLFEGLDLAVPPGSCFGLLGRNGAGKTTLMKLACGLLRQKGGRIDWWGRPMDSWQRRLYTRIGLLIGEPRLYNHLSGWENLAVYATYRRLGNRRIPPALEQTGLTRQADKRVQHYSTGMRQRLGIALAILHEPDFLVLDEPTNGLDPQGIAEVRQMILRLREQHTLLVSSHLLSEVEQTCTHLAVLDEGKSLFQGTLSELRARKARSETAVRIETVPGTPWPKDLAGSARPEGESGYRLIVSDKGEIPPLIDQLRDRSFPIFQIWVEEPDLETSFLSLFPKAEP